MKRKKSLYFAKKFDAKKARHLFKLLKRDFYYENVNLFGRMRVAEYETSDLEIKLKKFASDINSLNTIKEFDKFKSDFRILPKKVRLSSEESHNAEKNEPPVFISNVRADEGYILHEVNYFIDAPVEVLLISLLWSVTVGVLLDKHNTKGCIGYRLNIGENEDFNEKSQSAFKYYVPEYQRWRDQAIKAGLSNLESGNDILLIAMDIRQCFYFLQIDWMGIEDVIAESSISDEEKEFCNKLNKLLREIHKEYFKSGKVFFRETHYKEGKERKEDTGLPIGLPSSRVLTNWSLRQLDALVNETLRPVYYGRYVDDFLIVLNNPGVQGMSTDDIIDKLFIEVGFLTKNKENKTYHIDGSKKQKKYLELLEIQKSKLILHYYSHKGSWAGLTEFKKELEKQASEFRFLPVKEDSSDFMDESYDMNFEGSKNTLRSLIGVKENFVKISGQLYRRTLRYWLENKKINKAELSHLERFFQGKNFFDYTRSWERLFSLFVGTSQLDLCWDYYQVISDTIERLFYFSNEDLAKKTREDLSEYLKISLASSICLDSRKNRDEFAENHGQNDLKVWSESFRKSRMVRHEMVRWPLLEYTGDDISLVSFDPKDHNNSPLPLLKFHNGMFKYAPRFIYHHEYALFWFLQSLLDSERKPYDLLLDSLAIKNGYENLNQTKDLPVSVKPPKPGKILRGEIEIKDGVKETGKFCIGIANIKVLDADFKSSYVSNSQPNLSVKRQNNLIKIINEASKGEKCDLIILPEVSVPYMWLPFMANMARKHALGMVFGLEHIVVNGYAYNLTATILPYKTGGKFNNCFISLRTKNHYSHEEKIELKSYGHKIPKSSYYEKILWRNAWFSAYNCFELTDIHARGLFRSELDFIVSILWNRDTNYYSNIIESISRDLHVYVAQANTSDYGDSRIVAPRKTEQKDVLRVKGGENAVLIKGIIDIKKLRDFQYHEYIQSDESFKPAPAGFDHDKARKKAKK